MLLNTKWVSIFSATFVWNVSHSKKNAAIYRVAPKNVYTIAAVRRLRQCLDADGGHFEHLHWIQNSRTSLIPILVLYKYSIYYYRVIFFMSKCAYIFLGHSVYGKTKSYAIFLCYGPLSEQLGPLRDRRAPCNLYRLSACLVGPACRPKWSPRHIIVV